MSATKKNDLILSLDVGHSSIGWNVLQQTEEDPRELGLGAVIFEADSCLASKRRDYRRQRRTIRSRRQRIAAIERLFVQQKLLSQSAVDSKHRAAGGNAAPWLLAAAVLAGKGKCRITAEELFDVIRWYAHNRGYDGNRRWAGVSADNKEDTEREEAALNLMQKHGTATMAETVSAQLGLSPDGHKKASGNYYKGRDIGAAFPRKIVTAEVRNILQAHVGALKGCTDKLIDTLCGETDDAWKTIPVDDVRQAKNYKGGLLFGQKVPRFDNRILTFCPISDTPTPLKSCIEFMAFRCAMFLANVSVLSKGDSAMRPLTADELKEVWGCIHKEGYLPAGEFKKLVRRLTASLQDNLDSLMLLDDAATNLVVDPVLKLVNSNTVLKGLWPEIPATTAELLMARLRSKQRITVAEILAAVSEKVPEGLNAAIQAAYKKEQKKNPDKARWMETKSWHADYDSGRAPYSRGIMRKAVEEILEGKDPREKGRCLYITEAIRAKQAHRRPDELTNNHLVRHRLLILDRLVKDILAEYADGNRDRIGTVVVEVNREVAAMSGKTIKQIKMEEGLKRADHKRSCKIMEDAVQEAGADVDISAGLIRKARIAEDLGWTCPYTGKKYGPLDLVYKQVDLDHIIPRSERLSDAMSGLVITFSEVNKWKGKRTAWQFVNEEQSKAVQGNPALQMMSLKAYQAFVEKLKTKGGADEDESRRKSRRHYLLMPDYVEKSFTPRDLTISSYVSKLAVQQIKNTFEKCKHKPQVISIPGRLTGEARKNWQLIGLLHAVNPDITGKTLKADVRDMTHLHHALDAAVMGLLAANIRDLSDGATWQLLLKRHLTREEVYLLKDNIRGVSVDSAGRAHLQDIPKNIQEQLTVRLSERRVIQHVPASMSGLSIEENTRGIIGLNEDSGKVILRQRKDGKPNVTEESPVKVLGFDAPEDSKLKKQKGARVVDANYGVALTSPEPQIIPWHKIWPRLNEIRGKTGKWPQVLRNGMIIHIPKGRYQGSWRVFSTKNNKSGIAVDLGKPDETKLSKTNVLMKSLINSGMSIQKTKLTGNRICHITSSILTVPISD